MYVCFTVRWRTREVESGGGKGLCIREGAREQWREGYREREREMEKERH